MLRGIWCFVLALLALVTATAAVAAVPDPIHTTIPTYIRVGGARTNAGVPDPTIGFNVTVRDFANNPVPGSLVEINFANCSDTKLCTAVIAGQAVDCWNLAVRATTNVAGQVTMSIMGGSTNTGTVVPPAIAPGAGLNCVRMYADGILLGVATSVVYDQNGSIGGNGVTPLDLAIMRQDVVSGRLGAPYRGRADYSADGRLGAKDVRSFIPILAQSGLGNGSGAGCAGGGAPQPYCP